MKTIHKFLPQEKKEGKKGKDRKKREIAKGGREKKLFFASERKNGVCGRDKAFDHDQQLDRTMNLIGRGGGKKRTVRRRGKKKKIKGN